MSSVPKSDRCLTGVEGLDDILAGGLPRNCFYLVQGDPGSGKTTLALQFLLEGIRQGETALHYAFGNEAGATDSRPFSQLVAR